MKLVWTNQEASAAAWLQKPTNVHCHHKSIIHASHPSNLALHILPPNQPVSILPCIAQVRPQLLIPNLNLLRLLQHEEHARPLRARRVPPPMVRAPLHRHIAPPHDPLHPIIQYHLHLSLQDDPIVERLRTVYQGLSARTEIDNAGHGAVRVHQSQLLRLNDLVVGNEIGVAAHVRWEGGGGVDDVEGHRVVDVRRPGAGLVGLDDGVPGGIVAGYVVREAWEALGELGFVAGTSIGHGAGFLKGSLSERQGTREL